MSAVEWEAPPPKAKGGGKPNQELLDLAAALRERPGEWAVIRRDYPVTGISSYNSGRIAAFPKGEFEFTSRTVPGTRRCTLYGRYVGASGAA